MPNVFDELDAQDTKQQSNVFDSVPASDNHFDGLPSPSNRITDDLLKQGPRTQLEQAGNAQMNAGNTDLTLALGHELPAAIGSGLHKLGREAYNMAGAYAFEGLGEPELQEQQLEGQTNEKGQTPIEEGAADLPAAGRALAAGSKGIIQTVPQMAGVAAGQALGVPAPISAGAIFGLTPEGIDPEQAAIGALAPEVGQLSGPIVESLATRLGVHPEVAAQVWQKIGGPTGATALLGADQAAHVMQLPPDQRKEAIIDAVGNVASMAGLGFLHGEPEKAGVTPEQDAIARQNLSIRDKPAQVVQTSKPVADLNFLIGSKLDEIKALLQEQSASTKGGSEAELPPEAQATSKANNSRAAFEALAKEKGTPLPQEADEAAIPADVDPNQVWNPESETPNEQVQPTQEQTSAQTGSDESSGTSGIRGADEAGQSEVPSEGGSGTEEITGPRNAITAEKREELGLPEATPHTKRGFAQIHGEAASKVAADTSAGIDLINELKDKPRPLTDSDVALMAHEQLRRENAVDEAATAVNEAKDDATRVEASVKLSAALDDVKEVYDVGKKVGTLNAQGLNARRIMLNSDFSLARMLETKRAVANEGKPLSEAQRQEVIDLHKKLSDTQTAFDDYVAKTQLQRSPKQRPVRDYISTQAQAARERIRARAGNLNVGLDPANLIDHAIVGADLIAKGFSKTADWGAEMIREFGDYVKPHLKAIWDEAQKQAVNMAKAAKSPEQIISGISERIKSKAKGGSLDDIGYDIQKLAGHFVQAGVKDRDALVKAVHDVVKKVAPEVTPREVADAISGYGKYKPLSADEVKTRLRDLKGQLQQVSKLEDMQSGKAPSKTGVERRTPSDEERRLIQQVNEMKKKEGFTVTDPETQLKSSLESQKTRLKNQISDLQKQIDTGEKIVKSKTPPPSDEAVVKLKAQRDELKKQYDALFNEPKRTPEQAKLQALKTRLQNRIAEYERRTRESDFSKPTRNTVPLDNEAVRLKAAAERARETYQEGLRKDTLAKRSTTEKALDLVANIRRMGALSGIRVLGKLAAYTATKMPLTVATEAVGGALGKVPGFRRLMAGAPSEGGFHIKQVTDSIVKGFTKGITDAKATLKGGRSELKESLGVREYPKEWHQMFQTLHEAVKSPLRRQAFELSMSKRLQEAAKRKVDITDPLVQLSIAKDAYLDSDRALLLEQNRLATGIRNLFKSLERPDSKTGKVPTGGKLLATAGRVELPILTVPLNFIRRTLNAIFGTGVGAIRLIKSHMDGIEKLSPAEHDEIARHFKEGSIGFGFLLWGFLDGYNNGANGTFGGYYQPHEKRKDDQAGVNGMRVGNHNLSGLFLHNPFLATAQFGHTMGNIANSQINKRNTEKRGVLAGTAAAAFGLLSDSPLGQEGKTFETMADSRQASSALAEHVKGLTIPQGVQDVAKLTDFSDNGFNDRKPTNAVQHLETGIPGLRQNVPLKK